MNSTIINKITVNIACSREGCDSKLQLEVPYTDTALGAKIEIEDLNQSVQKYGWRYTEDEDYYYPLCPRCNDTETESWF